MVWWIVESLFCVAVRDTSKWKLWDQRQGWNHHRAETEEYEVAYELSLERPQLIHKYKPKSTAVLMKATRLFPELSWTSVALSMNETRAPQLASVSLTRLAHFYGNPCCWFEPEYLLCKSL